MLADSCGEWDTLISGSHWPFPQNEVQISRNQINVVDYEGTSLANAIGLHNRILHNMNSQHDFKQHDFQTYVRRKTFLAC